MKNTAVLWVWLVALISRRTLALVLSEAVTNFPQAMGEPLYRVSTGNYEYRLVLRCRQEARARFAKMRKDVLEKIELLDQKHGLLLFFGLFSAVCYFWFILLIYQSIAEWNSAAAIRLSDRLLHSLDMRPCLSLTPHVKHILTVSCSLKSVIFERNSDTNLVFAKMCLDVLFFCFIFGDFVCKNGQRNVKILLRKNWDW